MQTLNFKQCEKTVLALFSGYVTIMNYVTQGLRNLRHLMKELPKDVMKMNKEIELVIR